jgi:hypothetical protein
MGVAEAGLSIGCKGCCNGVTRAAVDCTVAMVKECGLGVCVCVKLT